MSVNLLEKVQQNLGYPPLQKIDPNTGQQTDAHTDSNQQFGQAAIPAMLTALYKYVQSDAGAEDALRGNISTNWEGKIFHDNNGEVLAKIEASSPGGIIQAPSKMNAIANEAIKVMKENLGDNAGIKEVKTFFLNQRSNILPYLLPEIKLGVLLNDDTIDDNTNKMEGPVSSLIKSIGSAFDSPVTREKVKGF